MYEEAPQLTSYPSCPLLDFFWKETYLNDFFVIDYISVSFFVAAVMGALDYVSDLCDCSRSHDHKKLKKRKPLQMVEIKVRMDCEGCERKVKKSVEGMKGVTQVEVDRKQHKLTVTGYVDPNKVLQRVRYRTGKKAELWPYVPYDVVSHPYAPGVYDKKAPPGYVRNPLADPQTSSLARASSTEVKYTTVFSDDNPNACVVM